MSGGERATAQVSPQELIDHFCGDAATGLVADPGVSEVDGVKKARGFCGYNGRRDSNRLLTGFDDGYDWMEFLGERGWAALPAKGEWPYLVYMQFRPKESEEVAIAEYCEGDLTIWMFATPDVAKRHYADLKDCP